MFGSSLPRVYSTDRQICNEPGLPSCFIIVIKACFCSAGECDSCLEKETERVNLFVSHQTDIARKRRKIVSHPVHEHCVDEDLLPLPSEADRMISKDHTGFNDEKDEEEGLGATLRSSAEKRLVKDTLPFVGKSEKKQSRTTVQGEHAIRHQDTAMGTQLFKRKQETAFEGDDDLIVVKVSIAASPNDCEHHQTTKNEESEKTATSETDSVVIDLTDVHSGSDDVPEPHDEVVEVNILDEEGCEREHDGRKVRLPSGHTVDEIFAPAKNSKGEEVLQKYWVYKGQRFRASRVNLEEHNPFFHLDLEEYRKNSNSGW